MNPFQEFQRALEEQYSDLTFFSEIPWSKITHEYIATHEHPPTDVDEFVKGFPFFLQEKSAQDECPDYLVEIAFYNLSIKNLAVTSLSLPEEEGLYLNSSLSFLQLEFDIIEMLELSSQGVMEIIPRPHVLGLLIHPDGELKALELQRPELELLQVFESGPFHSKDGLSPEQNELLSEMIDLGCILEIS